jgi:hypothetical protein
MIRHDGTGKSRLLEPARREVVVPREIENAWCSKTAVVHLDFVGLCDGNARAHAREQEKGADAHPRTPAIAETVQHPRILCDPKIASVCGRRHRRRLTPTLLFDHQEANDARSLLRIRSPGQRLFQLRS